MIDKKQLKARLKAQEYVRPFIRVLAMESLPSGFVFVVLDMDIRKLSHILESDKHPTRLCFTNGEIFYLKDNQDLSRIKHLRSQFAESQVVEEFLIMNN